MIGRSDGHMLLSTDSYGISTTRRSSSVTLVILSVLVAVFEAELWKRTPWKD